MELVEVGDLFFEQRQQRARMLDGHANASAGRIVVAQLAGHHEGIDIDFHHAAVVPHRFQSLYFNVIGFQAGSPGAVSRQIVRACEQAGWHTGCHPSPVPNGHLAMLERIPPWVFAIFVVLVVIGLLLRRTRAVAPTAVAVVAVAMLALSLFGVVGSFGATPGPLLSWAVGIALAASIGGQVFGPHGLQVVPDSAKVLVPGSWVPLVLMMGIFLGKFIVGFAVGVGAPMVKQAWFGLAAALAFGVFSGGFVARAIAVRRFARHQVHKG